MVGSELLFFFQAEDGIRDVAVTGVQTCALPICGAPLLASSLARRIPRFFVPGGRATRHPLPGPPAPSETTTATVAESCTANVPVACPGPPSLVSQSDDGIDAHRAACWNVTGGTRHAY